MMNLFSNFTKLQIVSIVIIVFLTFFLRFTFLGNIPSGLTNDEADVGYDAYSILKTGKDQWGINQPAVYLKGFGDNRPPLYTYMVIPSIKLFGLNEFAVRFPSALLGSLTVVFLGVLVFQLFKRKWIAISSMFFLAINPWHVGMSRVGIESTVGVFLIVLAVTFFVLGLTKRYFLLLSMLFFLLSIYTYTSYVVLAPLFIVLLLVLYLKQFFKEKIFSVLSLMVVALLLMPLLFNGLKTASTRSSQVNFTSDVGILNILNDERGECLKKFSPIYCQLVQNKFSAYTFAFINNYIHHFSTDVLMVEGVKSQYSVLPKRGLLYISEFILFFIGILVIIKYRKREHLLILFWFVLAPIPDSFTGNGHYSRFLPILPAIQIAAALGAYELVSFLKDKMFLSFPIFFFFLFEFIFFSTVYFSYFPQFYAIYSHYGYKDLFQYIQKHKDGYLTVKISSRINDTKQYIYYLFYTAYDPALYQKGTNVKKILEKNSWVRVEKIDNIEFLPTLEGHTGYFPKDVLLVGAAEEFSQKIKSEYVVSDPKNNPIFLLVNARKAYPAPKSILPY